ncbi:unnamed protein product [Polarella glacialis]|uniref:SET domain-containing protein n=2 Tax=Polarella glacialis TaxID=89957 RepID=A0A813I300_POLGL|nr:unnamed protein product [Polarella glacialis]
MSTGLERAGATVASDPDRPHLGRFLRAARSLERGEVVLQDTPLLRVRGLRGYLSEEALGSVDALKRAELFVPEEISSAAVQRLRNEADRRGANRTGSQARSAELCEAELLISSVLHFNAFASGPSGRDQAVFANLARANHSCSPNCIVDGDQGTLRTLRAVGEGEELTLSYLDDAALLRPKERRRSELAKRYEFSCCCARCSAPADDTRRFRGRCHALASKCGGELLVHRDPKGQVFLRCEQCGEPATQEVSAELLSAEEAAFASLRAANSGDLEEEDEGQMLMKCWKFATKHPCHAAAVELANDFAFPDAVPAKRVVLEALKAVLGTPCQLAVDTRREVAELLEKRGDADGARVNFEEAASMACILDGRTSMEEVLREWDIRVAAPAASAVRPEPTGTATAAGSASVGIASAVYAGPDLESLYDEKKKKPNPQSSEAIGPSLRKRGHKAVPERRPVESEAAISQLPASAGEGEGEGEGVQLRDAEEPPSQRTERKDRVEAKLLAVAAVLTLGALLATAFLKSSWRLRR